MIGRGLVASLLVGAALLPAAAPAAASPAIGLSDQNASSWSQPGLLALDLRYARLVVPWDAAWSEPDRVQAWLDAVAAAGQEPHIAFEHLRSDRCPGWPCVTPSRSRYREAIDAFIRRFPQVHTYTTWNEANHRSQPVAGDPEQVAGYWEELSDACSGCTIVSGDVLDSGSYTAWLRRFQEATDRNPRRWGLHNYGDVTYGGTEGTDAVLDTVPGRVWLEETGGIVTLRNSRGRTTLRYSESRAESSIARAFDIARSRPRISRLYIYHWKAGARDRFDAGLVRPDNTARPSYDRLVREIRATRNALQWRATWSKVKRRQLLVRVRCEADDGNCRGRVRIRMKTQRERGGSWAWVTLKTRTYRTTSKRSILLRVTVRKSLRDRARGALRRRIVVITDPEAPEGDRQKRTVAVRAPYTLTSSSR